MSRGQKQAAAAELARAAHAPPNGEVESIEAEIRDLERRYEMTSAQMEARVSDGRMAETEDVARWLIAIEARRISPVAKHGHNRLASYLDLPSPKGGRVERGGRGAVSQSRLQDGKRLSLDAKVTVHDLRRTWRSLAMDLGIDHAVARLSLGHAGLEGVEGVYGRAQMIEQRAEAADLVAAALDRIRLGKVAQVMPMREQGR